jgi:hypothetical protein
MSDRISLIGRLTRQELRSGRIPAAHVVERTLRLVQRKHSGRARDQRNDYDQDDETCVYEAGTAPYRPLC